MINSANRKREIFTITANLNAIQDANHKNLMAAVTFPRIYSHYEKFMWETFVYTINKIYEKNLKLSELNPKIQFLLFSFTTFQKSNIKIINKCSNLNLDEKTNIFDKELVFKEIKASNSYHKNLKDLLTLFSLDNHTKVRTLISSSNLLRSKYDSRCDIAHGEENIDDIEFVDWQVVKDKVIEIFDLVTEIFDDYLDNESYRH